MNEKFNIYMSDWIMLKSNVWKTFNQTYIWFILFTNRQNFKLFQSAFIELYLELDAMSKQGLYMVPGQRHFILMIQLWLCLKYFHTCPALVWHLFQQYFIISHISVLNMLKFTFLYWCIRFEHAKSISLWYFLLRRASTHNQFWTCLMHFYTDMCI